MVLHFIVTWNRTLPMKRACAVIESVIEQGPIALANVYNNFADKNCEMVYPKCGIVLMAVVAAVGFAVCHQPGFAQSAITLVGSGGTSSLPVFRAWTAEYNKRNSGIGMQYLPVDTSAGIAEILKGSADFGAGDAPLSLEQRSRMVMQLPVMLIALVPAYNLPGPALELRFSGELLAHIYLGKIKNWNDSQIARLNPHASLPNLPIKVIYRQSGKGDNFIFTDFLSKTSPQFRDQVGRSISPVWPVGASADGSADMADKVKNESGTIGYVWSETYPIASFGWVYLRTTTIDPQRRSALVDLLNWMLTEGQQSMPLGYFPLPHLLLAKVRAKIPRPALAKRMAH